MNGYKTAVIKLPQYDAQYEYIRLQSLVGYIVIRGS